MKSVLIECTGFIGDVLMASSVAEKLKTEGQFEVVDYSIPVLQPLELLDNNPFIDNVYVSSDVDLLRESYDKVVRLPLVDQSKTPPFQFQEASGVNNPDSKYKIYTNSALDYSVKLQLDTIRSQGPVIAWQSNWEEKSFGLTEDEYQKGINVPNLGYGGRRRNIKHIISQVGKYFPNLIEVGFPINTDVHSIGIMTTGYFSMTASIIKNCDYFIGAESGLCNLAAGVGTKTIITGDFVHQLYGWNGVIKKIQNPKLGPEFYFENGHKSLDPYLTDDEVINQIRRIVQ